MSNTVITNFTDLHGPTSKADKSLIVIVNKDGTLSMEKSVYEVLASENNEYSESAPVSVVRIGTDGRPEDATDSETEDENISHVNITVGGYFSEDLKVGSDKMEGLSLEMRERSLKGLSHDHCYTNLSSIDEPLSELSNKVIPSSKKITILEQQIIPKGRKLVLNPSQGVVVKGTDVLSKQITQLGNKQSSEELSKDDEMKDDSFLDVDSDSSSGGKKKSSQKGIKKQAPKKFIKLGSKSLTNEQLKNLLKQEINTKVLDKKSMQMQRKVIQVNSPESQRQTILRSSPAWKKDGPSILKRLNSSPKTYTKLKNIDMSEKMESMTHFENASLGQIISDSNSAQQNKEPSHTTMVNPNHLSNPLTGPLSPSLDLLGGIQPEEEGLSEDLLMHVAQLVESSENLQEVIDKQVLGKSDTNPQNPFSKSTVLTPKTVPPKVTTPVRKEPTQIVRSGGRVITLPPIEAPATRSSKRKSAVGSNEPNTSNIVSSAASMINKPTVTTIHAPSRYNDSVKTSSSINEQIDFESLLPENTIQHPSFQVQPQSPKKNVAKIHLEPKASTSEFYEDVLPAQDTINSEDDPYRLWCICRTPHNNRFMICCDKCEDWFHGKCVNITKAMGQQMEEKGIEWTCPNCRATKPKSKASNRKSFESKPTSVQHKNADNRMSAGLQKNLEQRKSIDYGKLERKNIEGQKIPGRKSLDGAFREGRKSGDTRKSLEKINQSKTPTEFRQKQSMFASPQKDSFCIVCKKMARPSSIYCSDACILRHAQESLAVQSPLRSSPGDQSPRKPAPESRVIVFERKTGRCLAGPNAPTAENLKTWLQEHPTFEVVRPGTLKTNKQMVNLNRDPPKQPPKTVQSSLKFEKKPKALSQPEFSVQTKTPLSPPPVTEKKALQPSPVTERKGFPPSPVTERKGFQPSPVTERKGFQPSPVTERKEFQPSPVTERKGFQPLPVTERKGIQPSPVTERKGFQASLATERKGLQPSPMMEKKGMQPPSVMEKKGPKLIDIMNPAPKPKIIQVKQMQSPRTPQPPMRQTILTPSKPVRSTPTISKSVEKEKQIKSPTTPSTSKKREAPEPKPKTPSGEPVRDNVRKALHENMTARMRENKKDILSDEDIQTFALETEQELFELFPDVGIKYKAKYRSLVFNIKDRKNEQLWQKICDKSLLPKALVRLSAEELASQELAQWRDKEAKHQLELIKKNEIDLLSASQTYVVKTHKGEEVIESKSTVSSSALDPNVPMEDLVSALNEDEHGVDKSKPSKKSKSSRKNSPLLESASSTRSSSRQKSLKEDKSRSLQKKEDSKKDKAETKKGGAVSEERRSSRRGREKSRERSRERSRSRSRRRSERKRKDRSLSREHSRVGDRSKRSRSSEKSRHRSGSKRRSRSKYHSRDRSKGRTPSRSPPKEQERPKSSLQKDVHPEYDPHERMVTSAFSEEKDDMYEYASDLIEKDYESMQCDPEKIMALDSTLVDPDIKADKVTSTAADSDQEPTSTVDTNPIAVWNGCINMVDVARFYVAAHELAGSCSDLEEELSAELDIVGRINPATVWDYIGKMKRAGNKDIAVLRLTAANEEEAMQYIALYSYLSSRQRLGVVKVTATMASVKDLYVVPVEAGAKPAAALGPLPVARAHSLLALVVRQRRKRPATSTPQNLPPAKSTRMLRSFTPTAVTASPVVGSTLSSTVKDQIASSLISADDGNEPYTPGGSDSDIETPTTSSRETEAQLKQKMEELNRKIHEERAQIMSMAGKKEDVSGSLADIALPSNLQEILASIQRPAQPSKLSTLTDEELLSMVPDNE